MLKTNELSIKKIEFQQTYITNKFNTRALFVMGEIGIRKISLAFHILFRTPLGDIHHAFHRMKERTGSRTTFLDKLKFSLEEYMDKDL